MSDAFLVRSAKNPPTTRARGYWHNVGGRLRRDYVTLFFASLNVVSVLAAVFAPLVAPFDPNATSMVNRLKPIGYKQFILGTDELGRDMLSRLTFGGRMSPIMHFQGDSTPSSTIAGQLGGTIWATWPLCERSEWERPTPTQQLAYLRD